MSDEKYHDREPLEEPLEMDELRRIFNAGDVTPRPAIDEGEEPLVGVSWPRESGRTSPRFTRGALIVVAAIRGPNAG